MNIFGTVFKWFATVWAFWISIILLLVGFIVVWINFAVGITLLCIAGLILFINMLTWINVK